MVAKKATNEPKNLVIWVIHVSNLPAMSDRFRNAGKRCPGISCRIVRITFRRRQDRRAACVETAESIELVAGRSATRLESHQWVASHWRPNQGIRRESRYCEPESHDAC